MGEQARAEADLATSRIKENMVSFGDNMERYERWLGKQNTTPTTERRRIYACSV